MTTRAGAAMIPPYQRRAVRTGVSTPFDRIALLGLVGFIVLGTTYLAGGAKLISMVGIAGLLADRLFGRRRLEFGGSIGSWLLAYSAVLVIATPTSIWLGPSLEAILNQVKLLLIFMLAVGVSSTDARREWLLRLTVMLLVLFPARGALVAQLTGGVQVAGRADWEGLFGNANILAALLTLFLPFAIVWMRNEKRRPLRLLWGGSAAVLGAATLSSQSRSGLMSLVVVGIWILMASRQRARAVLLIVTLCAAAAILSPTGVGSRIATISYTLTGQTPPEEHEGDVDNAASRLHIWRAALDMVWHNPVLGVGPGTFEEAHRHYQRYVQWGAGALWIDTHNSFLRVWSETGTLGLVVFVGIFVTVFREGRRAIRALRKVGLGWGYDSQMVSAALAGLAAFLVANLFNTFKDVWLLYLYLAFCVLLVDRARRVVSAAMWRRATVPELHPALARAAASTGRE